MNNIWKILIAAAMIASFGHMSAGLDFDHEDYLQGFAKYTNRLPIDLYIKAWGDYRREVEKHKDSNDESWMHDIAKPYQDEADERHYKAWKREQEEEKLRQDKKDWDTMKGAFTFEEVKSKY